MVNQNSIQYAARTCHARCSIWMNFNFAAVINNEPYESSLVDTFVLCWSSSSDTLSPGDESREGGKGEGAEDDNNV